MLVKLLSIAVLSLTASAAVLAAPAGGESASEALQKVDDAQRAMLAEAGRKAAFFCANCHGEQGVSRYGEVPNLAGQHPAYILSQIEAFLAGTRKDDFMQGLMKVLSERDKLAIALYYASSPAPQMKASDGAGARLYEKHCALCHQPGAEGSESFPRLAGQQSEYLRISLRRYLAQSGERFSAPMTAAVVQLGEKNINAVVNHLAGTHATPSTGSSAAR
ncbi:c-type cytochrome [Thauera sp.]|uniref:c-type cytochrome n=1 Tax=Thauera sp. TaxID=1905334 RepID=UPI0039E6315B